MWTDVGRAFWVSLPACLSCDLLAMHCSLLLISNRRKTATPPGRKWFTADVRFRFYHNSTPPHASKRARHCQTMLCSFSVMLSVSVPYSESRPRWMAPNACIGEVVEHVPTPESGQECPRSSEKAAGRGMPLLTELGIVAARASTNMAHPRRWGPVEGK
jgi:hypothetical protein